MSKAELDAAKLEITSFIRERLQGYVGQLVDKEKIERYLLETLEQMEKQGRLPRELEKFNRATSELLATTFSGFPEGFDPKVYLRELPTHFLLMLRESFGWSGGFPVNVIWLEIFHREGKLIGDWFFERKSQTEAKLNFQLKQKLDYIALDMLISEEKKN